MNRSSIATESEYRDVLKEISQLMTAVAGTPEGARLEALVNSVEAYEREHYPMDQGVVRTNKA